ncbi:pilus assembly FimT family protein [Pajaroellobacter abortibovis]|uniref:Uncharacterized protein n=1 Tax=Pajaroellobacter abortibovis TaxID=1882918 RepID=A0A1L6MZR9_9BACT|nr:hypothetical protein [Pajaroellobacter abortibovis]APS00885.1 hypothetical protein BCY86_04470 [Pajaroellobacter abortibovis]
MTLVEILIAILLVVFISASAMIGLGQLNTTRLHKSATMLRGGIRVAFTRAMTDAKSVRMVFDLDTHTAWLEEGGGRMLVQMHDKTGTGGADPVTEIEKEAVKEGEKILKGAHNTISFHPIKDLGFEDPETGEGVKHLEKGIKFRSVHIQHEVTPKTQGRAYLYFWPEGMTEEASIQLMSLDAKDSSSTLTLLVSALTGRVVLEKGAIDLKLLVEEDSTGFSFSD